MLKTFAKFFFHPIIRHLRWLQFALALLIFFYAALMPVTNTPTTLPPGLLHFIGNVLLICSAWTALCLRLSLTRLTILCGVISLTAEITQGLTASRSVDALDLLINLLGLLCGLCLCYFLERLLRVRDTGHTSPSP